MHINDIVIEGLLDTGVDVTIITPESWHPDWPLQEADIQLLGIGTLSQVKQSMRQVLCIRPEGEKGRVKRYVANIAVNLRGCDLLQQWNTQINIPAVPKTCVSEEKIRRYYRKQMLAILDVQEHRTIDNPSDIPTALTLNWFTEKPIWVKQWLLAEKKLHAFK